MKFKASEQQWKSVCRCKRASALEVSLSNWNASMKKTHHSHIARGVFHAHTKAAHDMTLL